MEITMKGYQCERCAHQWAPRDAGYPKVCPKCKSPYWDRPRKIAIPPHVEETMKAVRKMKGARSNEDV